MSRNVVCLSRKQLDSIAREVDRHPFTSHAIIVADTAYGSEVRLRLLTKNGRRSIRDVWLGLRGRVEPRKTR